MIAGKYITIEFILAIILVPIIGRFIDKKGYRIKCFAICVFLTIISTTLFMFIRPLVPAILGGIALSIFFAIKRPILAYIVDKPEIVILFMSNYQRVLGMEFNYQLKIFLYYCYLYV